MICNHTSDLDTWISQIKELVSAEEICFVDGSKRQLNEFKRIAVRRGVLHKLNEEKLPNCYLRRSNPNDVARTEGRTFICSREEIDAGPTNNWMDSKEAYNLLYSIARGSYKGKTMYVIPYSMGPVGSSHSKPGIEITDSLYVVISMCIMTRVSSKIMDMIRGGSDWVKGLHATCDVDPEKRYICHFPEDDTIISVNSEYGGNVLLGKKCFALRIASYKGFKQGWMAEHMLILCVEFPDGDRKYVAAAFPSACGKTNLAMLIPPEIYRNKGYKVWTVGDDIAWMKIGDDGTLRAINPENGFFGVVPGTNEKSNPNALKTIGKDTIYTNVVENLEDETVWWEGKDNNPPENALDWTGKPWNGKTATVKGAHPNSRFTAYAKNCPSLAKEEFDSPEGVPISAIIFGGRRESMTPLVYQSFNWQHGVFVGSIMSSETTAAATGTVGVVRRDPMAMLPFCGYNMGDYFGHWLDMGRKLGSKAPKIFNVNWFRKDDDGKYIWPGFGENMRVLQWILKMCEEGPETDNITPIGYVPNVSDLYLKDCPVDIDSLFSILSVNKGRWASETKDIENFYKKFGERLPEELASELEKLKNRLK